jgi:hypothetical protein
MGAYTLAPDCYWDESRERSAGRSLTRIRELAAPAPATFFDYSKTFI